MHATNLNPKFISTALPPLRISTAVLILCIALPCLICSGFFLDAPRTLYKLFQIRRNLQMNPLNLVKSLQYLALATFKFFPEQLLGNLLMGIAAGSILCVDARVDGPLKRAGLAVAALVSYAIWTALVWHKYYVAFN